MDIDDISCLNYKNGNYRPHPHRENIILFYACSDDDKKRWQWCVNSAYAWVDCSASKRGDIYPIWDEGLFYRLRPRICSVTVNGTDYEFPESCREPLKYGQEYWRGSYDGKVYCEEWKSKAIQIKWLAFGVIHLTKEAAEQHLVALQAVNMQVAQ